MNKELGNALDYDALDHAERITGVEYKKDEGTTLMGITLMQANNAKKNALLKATADVHWGMTMAEWLAAVEQMGFRLLHSEAVKDTGDTYYILWRDGILLVAESYWKGRSVNSAKCYFNFRGPRNAMRRCSNSFAGGTDDDPIWAGDYDSREGLRYTLEKMQAEGELLSKWVKQPFLWILSYADTKEEGYDYEAINKERIARLPDDVRAAIIAVQ